MAKGTDGAKKKQRFQTIRQMHQIYKFAAKSNPWLPYPMIGALVVFFGLGIWLCIATQAAWGMWILWMFTAAVATLLTDTIILTRVADSTGYKQMEGQPGATAGVLSSISKADFSFPQEPVWIDMKTRAAIWRGTGRPGVYLIGEGDPDRLMSEMGREERQLQHIAPGSTIPVIKICVGNGAGQVPLKRLRREVVHHKAVLSRYELKQLNLRLQTLQRKRTTMPRNVDPSRMKISNRMMRRHS